MHRSGKHNIEHWMLLARSLGTVGRPLVAKLGEVQGNPRREALCAAADAAALVEGMAPAPLKPVAAALASDLRLISRERAGR